MTTTREPRLLILETSGRAGQVALAEGTAVLSVQRLDETRRHARDLAPAVVELLTGQGWRPRDLHGVLVSRGPGSYTGLRVGIMSAKAFAYATGCVLLGIDTFAAIAWQYPDKAARLDVIADAQQEKVYLQSFARSWTPDEVRPLGPLTIRPVAEWLAGLEGQVMVSGPGLRRYENRLPAGATAVRPEDREPKPEALLHLGLARYEAGERDDPWTLEPLYLRSSSAEQQWKGRPSR